MSIFKKQIGSVKLGFEKGYNLGIVLQNENVFMSAQLTDQEAIELRDWLNINYGNATKFKQRTRPKKG